MSDWPFSDSLGPQDEWPGGNRYGVCRERLLVPRQWSIQDRALAQYFGVELPVMDWLHTETWMDQPCHSWCELEVISEPVAFSGETELQGVTYRQRVRYAKKYACARWETPDPLAVIRACPPLPPIRVACVVGKPLQEIEGAS